MTCDLHTHSQYSFDGNESVSSLCVVAAARNIEILAITDHCDMVPGRDGFSGFLRSENERTLAFQNVHPEQVELLNGIEIGNAINMPAETRSVLESRSFDFVLGAIHFLPDGTDIYQMKLQTETDVNRMFQQYFGQLADLVEMGGFDSLAHLDYPLRVLLGTVDRPTIFQYRDLVEPILDGLVRQKIALELNTRGTYDWQNRVGPEDWVLRKYRELGGTKITIGSDAHTLQRIGAGFGAAVAAMEKTGFHSFTVYRNRMAYQIPFTDI